MLLCVENNSSELENLVLRFQHADKELVLPASSVHEAVSALKDRSEIDVVVTDLHFGPQDPEGGLKVVKAAVQAGVPAIVLTGFGSAASAVTAMEHGAFSYVEKAAPGGSTYTLLRRKIAQARETFALRKTTAEQELLIAVQRKQLALDLRRAAELQVSWVPRDAEHHSWRVKCHFKPSGDVGGDFVLVVDGPDSSVAVIVGDATGHGVAAALMAARLRADIEGVARQLTEPKALIRALRQRLEYVSGAEQLPLLCTHFHGDGRVAYASAGHPPPLVQLRGRWELLRRGGPVIAEITANSAEDGDDVQLGRGDIMVMYSDGLLQTSDEDPEQLLKLLQAETEREASGGAGQAIEMLAQRLAEVRQYDDVLIVAVERML